MLRALAEAIFDHCELGEDTSAPTVDDLFSDSIAARHRRFIAVSLLRLLAANAKPFEDQRFRVAAFRLFESSLEDLYRALRIDPSWQTYEKQQRLADAAPAAEAALAQVIADLQGFHEIPQFRQDVMRTLNRDRYRPILAEFIPSSIARNSINAALGAAEEVVEAPDHLRLDAYRRASESLATLRTRAEDVGTTYCQRFVIPLAERVQRLLDNEISEFVGRPARLTARLAEKKYPLHVNGAPIELQFEVTNRGPGDAFDVTLRLVSSDGLVVEPSNAEVSLGNWPPRSLIVPIPARVEHGPGGPAIEVDVTWLNADRSTQSHSEIVIPSPQRPDVDWDLLGDPYPLDAVASEDQLVGRDEILAELVGLLDGESMGSALITGQKRVGKTSIARTLENRLRRDVSDMLVAYLEIGGYGGTDIASTVRKLGPAVCRRFTKLDPALADLSPPAFTDGSLAPAIEFFDDLRARLPGRKLLLILDEFDELPSAFLSTDDDARSFFLTLRTLTSEQDFAVILIGGEKMRFLLAAHGDTLNRFENFPVDYFDATSNWDDFRDLVRRPAANVLDYSDDAISAVYGESAGHPFFAKMICQHVAREARRRRDAHVTRPDVDAATRLALASAPAPRFQHFWTDGVAASDDRREYIKAARVKLLLALAQVLRRGGSAAAGSLSDEAKRFGLTDAEAAARTREFLERRILMEDSHEAVRPRIPFFGRWLSEYGAREIVTEVGAEDPVLEERRREEEAQVRPEEISEVIDRWGAYRGTPVTLEAVRAWLSQFEDVFERRLMFTILEGIDFYSIRRLEEIFEGLHARTLKRTRERAPSERLQRADILVSYFGGPAKSGGEMARLYRRVNNIEYDNVVEPDHLAGRVEDARVKAVVFVDDFVGSGESLAAAIKEMDRDFLRLASGRGLDIYVGIAAGFDRGFKHAQEAIEKREPKIRLLEGVTLSDADRVFSETSRYFANHEDLLRAEAVASRLGAILEKGHPLGYETSQAAVVFGTACPNNSLPILWKTRGDWRPLFPRH